MINILYKRKGYPEVRMIINKTNNHYFYLSRKLDFHYLYNRILVYLVDRSSAYNIIHGLYNPIFVPKSIDLVHSLNMVCVTKKKWIVSCEWDFPAIYPDCPNKKREKLSKKYIKYALMDNCIAILPFSNSAKEHILQSARSYLSKEEFLLLAEKMHVLYPPQKVISNLNRDKFKNLDNLQLIFVGRQFFRKGGGVVIQAIKHLRENGYSNFELTIVSSLESDGKAYNLDKSDVIDYIQENSFIHWYESLDNQSVIELVKNCNIGLLPTFSDTFGFSVLEMQACGVPVISSNINALKEINNDDVGWIIDLESINSAADYNNKSDCEIIQNIMADTLFKILASILDNVDISNLLMEKSVKCISQIEKNHSEELYNNRLEKLFKHK